MARKIALFLVVLLGCGISASAQRRIVNVGIVNKKAIYLPKPVFPKGCRCKGVINATVLIDILSGNVVEANTKEGHPLLQVAAVNAARKARFPVTTYDGKPAFAKGLLVYKFN